MAIVRLPYRQEPFAQGHARPGAAEKLRLSVIIPVFNELAFIEELLLRVQDSMLADEIIVVDDGSTDGTRQLLRDLQEFNSTKCDFYFRTRTRAKARRCAEVSRKRLASFT